jgi:hypothetical protein
MADQLRVDVKNHEELGVLVCRAFNGKHAFQRVGLAGANRKLIRINAVGVDTTRDSGGEYSSSISQDENSEPDTANPHATTAPTRVSKTRSISTTKASKSNAALEPKSARPANALKRKKGPNKEENSLRFKQKRDYSRGIRPASGY